jgi:acetyl esterase/lipase
MPSPVFPRPPFDRALTAVVGQDESPSKNLDVATMRRVTDRWNAEDILKKTQLAHTEYNIPAVQGLDVNNVTLSVFRSKLSTESNAKRPVLYYIHGGGQVSGNRFFNLDSAIDEISDIDAVFVSVEYRLAPENRAPAAAYDCYAGLVWITTNADDLGIDPSKILLYGISGGASVAVATSILARDRGYPKICAQMLIIPMLDDRSDSVSAKQFGSGPFWTGKMNNQAWEFVLGPGRGGTEVAALQVPGRATDLSGLPQTFIDVGECEMYRDEAVAFAAQIWKSGGTAELHVWPGAYHGAHLWESDAPVSRAMIVSRNTYVKRLLM